MSTLPTRTPTTDVQVPDIPPITTGPVRRQPSLLERITGIWATAVVLVNEGIRIAETFQEMKGPARKAFVVEQAMRAVRAAEAKANALPAVLEELVFRALELALEYWIVERVFRELEAQGAVNVDRAAAPARAG